MPERIQDRPVTVSSAVFTGLMRRIQALERGQVYTITLWVPDSDTEPQWVVTALGRIEPRDNARLGLR